MPDNGRKLVLRVRFSLQFVWSRQYGLFVLEVQQTSVAQHFPRFVWW